MNQKSEIATVVFLISGGKICLAKKKNSIHTKDGKQIDESKLTWSGYGGKREEEDVSIRDTAVRELFQESGVMASPRNLLPVAKCNFFWKGNISLVPNMEVYFFLLATFEKDPKETEEMGGPKFFNPDKIPYDEMMSADRIFLPKILLG